MITLNKLIIITKKIKTIKMKFYNNKKMSTPRIYKKGGKLRNLVIEVLNTKKENKKKTINLLTEIKNILNKEKLIIQLRAEFNYIKNLNNNYQNYLSHIKQLTQTYLKNKNKIEEYANETRASEKEYVKIIDKFEDNISNLKSEKQNLIKTNEAIMKMKNDINNTLNVKLLEIQTKINTNLDELYKINSKKEKLETQYLNEKKEFLKKEEKEEKKYKILQQKYNLLSQFLSTLSHKSYIYDIYPEEKPTELENQNLAESILEIENRNIKLREEEIKNQNLMDTVKNLSSKITNISSYYDDITTRRNTKSSKSIHTPIVSLSKRITYHKN